MDTLRSGISDEERQAITDALDIERAAERSPEDLERLGLVFRDLNAIDPGGIPVLLAWPVKHATVLARFVAFVFAPSRPMMAAGWLVAGYVERRPQGDVVVRQLAIEPERDGQSVTTDVLRSVRPATIIAKVRAYLAALPAVLELEQERGLRSEEPSALAAFAADVRTAVEAIPATDEVGRGYSDAFYERIARLALDEYHRHGRGVLARVAAKEARAGEPERPRETVKGWIREATRRGFLAPRQRGQGVFEPGWRLRESWKPPADESVAATS